MAYTDTDVSTGALGLAIGGAIVQFNKVAVCPQLVSYIIYKNFQTILNKQR